MTHLTRLHLITNRTPFITKTEILHSAAPDSPRRSQRIRYEISFKFPAICDDWIWQEEPDAFKHIWQWLEQTKQTNAVL
jgi:hypothetical protein